MRKKTFLLICLLAVGFGLTTDLTFSQYEGTQANWTKAQKAFDQKEFTSAIRYSSMIISADPLDTDAFNLRGSAYNNAGHFSKAVADYSQSLRLKPEQSDVYYLRAHSYDANGDYAHAISDYNKAISLGPSTQTGTVGAYNDLAWLFATCPQKKFRNGKQAVENAEAAWEASMKRQSNIKDTLAAAYAEAGDFATALKWEQEFLATPDLEKSNVIEANKRLALYHAGKPYIESN